MDTHAHDPNLSASKTPSILLGYFEGETTWLDKLPRKTSLGLLMRMDFSSPEQSDAIARSFLERNACPLPEKEDATASAEPEAKRSKSSEEEIGSHSMKDYLQALWLGAENNTGKYFSGYGSFFSSPRSAVAPDAARRIAAPAAP